MKIGKDWTIRRGPDPTAIDGRTLRLRDWAGVCRLNRRTVAKRRRARFLARLRALWCAAPEPATARIVSGGKWRVMP